MIVNKMPLRRKKDISNASIYIPYTQWTGSTIYLSDAIYSVSLDGKSLTEGIDYTLSGQTSGVGIGDYSATMTGIGKYEGSKTISWRISIAIVSATWEITINGVTVTSTGNRPLHTNVPVTPGVTYTAVGTCTWSAPENFTQEGRSWSGDGVYDIQTETATFSGKTITISADVKLNEDGSNFTFLFSGESTHYGTSSGWVDLIPE